MMERLEVLRQLTPLSLVIRLTLAMCFGGLIGLDRGQKGRPAGFRTYMLVCLGAALTMLLGQYEAQTAGSDVSRFGAQVINGIGFLGAGTIIFTGRQQVKGLTTAACLWASACVGLAIGAGFYEGVAIAFGLILLSVRLLPRLESHIIENARNINLYVEFQSLDSVGETIRRIKALDGRILEADISRGQDGSNPSCVFSIRLGSAVSHTRLLADLSGLESILVIEEL